MKKNKIIFISPSYYTSYGGAEIQAYKIINQLKSSNFIDKFQIEVVGTDPNHKTYLRFNFARKIFNNLYLYKIFKEIIFKRVSILHSHSFNAPAIFLGFFSHFFQIPMIIKITLEGENSKIEKISKNRVRKYLFKYFYSKVFFHVTVPSLIIRLKEIGIKQNNILHLPNGTFINNNSIQKKGKIAFCYTGRLIKRKQIFDLIQVFHKANLQRSIFNIYGDGPELKKISNYIKDKRINNIFLKGQYDYSENKITEICHENDIYISFSDSEAMSNASMEAASNSLLLVLRDLPSNKYIMPKNTNFLIKDTKSLDFIIRSIDKSDRYKLEQEISKQFEHIKNFDIKITANRIFEKYKELINTNST